MFKRLKSYIAKRQETLRTQRKLARTQANQSDLSPRADDDLVISIRPVAQDGSAGEWEKLKGADDE